MKKIISLFLAAVMIFSAVSFNASAAEKDRLGDLNGDGEISSADALQVLCFVVGKSELKIQKLVNADMNGDGTVNSADALLILQIVTGYLMDITAYPTLTPAWMLTVISNYREFSAECDTESRIPMIVSTDQHGNANADCEVFKFINDLVDWNKISKILNLGDTVRSEYNIPELEGFKAAMQYLPKEKRIDVCGNHDGHSSSKRRNFDEYYVAEGAEKSKKNDAFTVTDEQYNVRYLAVDPMNYPWKYTNGKIGTAQADFIIEQLEKTDSADIVLISHPYLFRDDLTMRDGTKFTGSEDFIGGGINGKKVRQSFVDMLVARKNKTAGVFTDSSGIKHKYDFTNCKSDFLMTLHGHHHTEGYETNSGITEFLFQCFNYSINGITEQNCFYFAYIDRAAKTFKCWKNIEGYDAFEINIA